MPRIHALLVGIDTYQSSDVPDLQGCENDLVLAERVLRDRVAKDDLVLATLRNEEATRAEIIRSFRSRLGAARAGDIALFWFSGHGSSGPLPAEIWHAESAGSCQTMVCHDSRAGAPDLYDKELAALVREVVASGAHLVTIQDSCHARSGMRGDAITGLPPRYVPPATIPPSPRDLLPELVKDAAGPTRPTAGSLAPRHVALAACDEWESAHELVFADGVHGVFSEALGHALARLGPEATYREVLNDARCRVEGRLRRQRPSLEAADDLADREFLGGALHPRAAQVTLRHVRNRWEVDIGAVHGTVAGSRLAVHRVTPPCEVSVVEVQVERSLVEPVGWSPDIERQYEMVLSDVPLPPVAVSIRSRPDVAAGLAAQVRTACAGGPSPHIAVIAPQGEASARLLLRVRQTDDRRRLQITSADHEPLAPAMPADDAGIARTVRDLEHIARWLQVRNLASPSAALADAVQLEVLPAPADGTWPPRDQQPPAPGDLEFEYTWTGSAWRPPSAFIRLRNTTSERLFCALLDLTDRFRMHAGLFPGEYVAGDWTAPAGRGAPITLSLPPDRIAPGATGTDWLVLLVAQEPFSSDPFRLNRLGEPDEDPADARRGGITGVLGRLGLLAVRRDLTPAPVVPLDWAVRVCALRTRVPDKKT